MKKVSLGLFVAAFLLAGCSSMDMDDMLADGLQSSRSEEERSPVMSEVRNVMSVCFMNYEKPGIVAKLRCEDGREEWQFRQELSDEDKKGMAETASGVLQRLPKGLRHTATCIRPRSSIRVYNAGFLTGENNRYRIIVVSEQKDQDWEF